MERIVVTVDGLAASGKTALAEGVARALGYAHLNSGLLYRAAAVLALQEGVDPADGAAMVRLEIPQRVRLHSRATDGRIEALVAIDGLDRTKDLSAQAVGAAASVLAQHAALREQLLPLQREAFSGSSLVAEGRDMGTVVFPDASVKFFITARIEVRAARRAAQLKARGESVDEQGVQEELAARDRRDSERACAPMKPAEDAEYFDNGTLGLADAIQHLVERVRVRSTGSCLR